MKYIAVILAAISLLMVLAGNGMFSGHIMNDLRAYFVCGFSSITLVLSLILFQVSKDK